ncbi:MAG: hypothetical protein ABSG17_08535 [Spirochaetia bacterium]
MKKSGTFLILLLSMVVPLAAQSNQLLDRLLDEPQAHFGDVTYMTLVAAKLLPDTATPEQALQTLNQQGWNITILAADAPISLGDYSYILMKAFKLPGGILYSLFPGPRYACRELGFHKIIPSDARPLRNVSGEEAVRILGNTMSYQGGRP